MDSGTWVEITVHSYIINAKGWKVIINKLSIEENALPT